VEFVWEENARGIFKPKRDEVTGGWGKPHTENLQHLCPSSNAIGIITSTGIGQVTHIGKMRN
jgi:hypothetical protein